MESGIKLLSVSSNVTEVQVWADGELYGAGAVSKNINDVTSVDIDCVVFKVMDNYGY